MTDAAALRTRLLALRRDALAQLDALDVIDSGLLRIAAHTTLVLHALDEADAKPEPPA